MKFKSYEYELALHEAGHFFCNVERFRQVPYMTAIFPERGCGICFPGKCPVDLPAECVVRMAGYAAESIHVYGEVCENLIGEFIEKSDGDYQRALASIRYHFGREQMTEDMLQLILCSFNLAQYILIQNFSLVRKVAEKLCSCRTIPAQNAVKMVQSWQKRGFYPANVEIASPLDCDSGGELKLKYQESLDCLLTANPPYEY